MSAPLTGVASRLVAAADALAAPLPADVRVVSMLDEPAPALADIDAATRVLVLDWLGTHRDARVPLLRAAWDVEETVRAASAHVLVLRLAPLIGPASPLVAWLASRPKLAPRLARAVVQPVLENDVVASLGAAFAGRVTWQGWYEACGPDPISVGELATLVAAHDAAARAATTAAEPSEAILIAQGLAEWRPWSDAFGLVPASITRAATLGSAA